MELEETELKKQIKEKRLTGEDKETMISQLIKYSVLEPQVHIIFFLLFTIFFVLII